MSYVFQACVCMCGGRAAASCAQSCSPRSLSATTSRRSKSARPVTPDLKPKTVGEAGRDRGSSDRAPPPREDSALVEGAAADPEASEGLAS